MTSMNAINGCDFLKQAAPATTEIPNANCHHDSIGSVTALFGSEGNLTDTYGYTAFGTQNERSGESEQPYTYLANAYDPATKLYDFHARQYDASAGRFMSEDPVAGITTMPQTLNPYPYGVNNPLAYPDPDGEIAPALLVVPVVVYLGRNALQSGTISAGSYYLTHRADKGGINRADFLRTVGRDAVFGSVNPLGGAGKAGKLLKARDDVPLRRANVLKPDGKLIGRAGSSLTIREVPGGTREAQALAKKLASGGTKVKELPGGGSVYKLPEGGYVTYRPKSKSGPPTINVNIPGHTDIDKIKFVG